MPSASLELIELRCGGKLYVERREKAETVALAIAFPVGSAHDPPGMSGLTHLLEHMLFRSNEKYSTRDIDRVFELSGGEANAYTYRDTMVVFFSVEPEGFKAALDALYHMVSSRKHREDEFESEKKIVYSEAVEHMETPQERVAQLAMEALFGRETPLGRPISGVPEEIERIGFDDLLEFKSRYFCCENAVAVLAGAVSRDHVELAAKVLSTLPEGGERPPTPQGDTTGPGTLREGRRDVKACYVAVAWSCPGLLADPSTPLRLAVLGFNLGAGATSVLFEELRVRRGLAYDYHEEHDYYKWSSYLLVAAFSVPADKLEEALEVLERSPAIVEERVLDRGYTQGRKRFLKYLTSPGRVESHSVAVGTAVRALRGNPKSFEECRREMLESDWSSMDLVGLLGRKAVAILEPS